MFELIRRDKPDRQARNVVQLLDKAAECLHTAQPQAADAFSPDLAEQVTQVFATVDALFQAASRELDRGRQEEG